MSLSRGIVSFVWSSLKDGNMQYPSLQRRFLEAIDAPPVGVHLVPRVGGWGTTIEVVDRLGPVKADALIVRHFLFRLTILPGDCPPIVLVDDRLPVIALIHGSRDALERDVIPRTLWRWRQVSGSTTRTYALVGPGIRRCCYRFPEPIAKTALQKWPAEHKFLVSSGFKEGCWSVDLQGFIGEQLSAGGLGGRLIIAPECTCCAKGKDGVHLFPSHRRSSVEKEPEGRFLAVAWLK